jgi:prophage regulatory protein
METNGAVCLLPVPEVERRTGLKKSRLYELVSQGAFPQPVRIGRRGTRFPDNEVNAWVSAQIRARDAQVDAKKVLLTPRRAAAVLGVDEKWLETDRRREGPRVAFTRAGPHIRYNQDTVLAALKARAIDGGLE